MPSRQHRPSDIAGLSCLSDPALNVRTMQLRFSGGGLKTPLLRRSAALLITESRYPLNASASDRSQTAASLARGASARHRYSAFVCKPAVSLCCSTRTLPSFTSPHHLHGFRCSRHFLPEPDPITRLVLRPSAPGRLAVAPRRTSDHQYFSTPPQVRGPANARCYVL